MKKSIFKIFKHSLINDNTEVLIWGSGSGYTKWKKEIEFHATAIIDNNSKLWGTTIDSIPVVSPDILNQKSKDNTIIFILSTFYLEIKEQIFSYDFEENNIYTYREIEKFFGDKKKKKRKKVFEKQNKFTIQEYIESLENDLKDIKYRDIELVPVLISYIALLTNYLFLMETNATLFPVPKKKEYYVIGNGPILLSYVWHEELRPDLNELISSVVSEIPKELLTEFKPRAHFEEEKNKDYITYSNSSITLDKKGSILRIKRIISDLKYHLNNEEIDWFMDFVQYFMNVIDQAYEFLSSSNYKVYISGFANNSEDNIHVQIAKKLGIRTFGLQHGTYGRSYEFNKVPFSHVYKYPTVDELFVWGEHSKKIIEEIQLDSSKITVVGHPRYNLMSKERNQIRDLKKKFINQNNFLVCFIGPGERELSINQELLNFADQLALITNMRYIVKMHPHNKILEKELYYKKENCVKFISGNCDIQLVFQKVDFIITTSSLAIHEAVYQYIPTFVYNAHQAVHSICGDLSTVFSKYEELESRIKQCMSLEGFNKIRAEYETQGMQYFKSYNQKTPNNVYKEKILDSF